MNARHPEMVAALCREIEAVARREEAMAADEASGMPYWLPLSESVAGHRRAAEALRSVARQLETEARGGRHATW
jgi:hypothetical protein